MLNFVKLFGLSKYKNKILQGPYTCAYYKPVISNLKATATSDRNVILI